MTLIVSVAAADPDVHADEYRRLPVHCAGVQLLPQVLRPGGGGRGTGLQVSRHALGMSVLSGAFLQTFRSRTRSSVSASAMIHVFSKLLIPFKQCISV